MLLSAKTSCATRWAGHHFLAAISGQLEAWRHRAGQYLVFEDLAPHSNVPGKLHLEPVDRSGVDEGEMAKYLSCGPIAECMDGTRTKPLGISQQLSERA